MGDPSTHVIFHLAYWYLVFKEDNDWVSTETYNVVCKVGEEHKVLELKEIT